MLRYLILKDKVGVYTILHDTFILRPYNETTQIHEQDKISLNVDPNTDPFVYIFKPVGDIREWWIITGNKDSADQARLYDMARTMFKKQFLQLRI